MAARPVGFVDYLLAAAPGIGNFLALYRTQGGGAHRDVAEILGNSIIYGAVAGVLGLFLMAIIYRRLGARAGGKSTTPQVIHVLAYGSVPLAASLAIWVLTALLAGEAAFVETPRADAEGFVVLLVHLQVIAYVLLWIWSIVLQVMGLSEIQGLATRKAFVLWVLGQIIGLLVWMFFVLVFDTLFPGVLLRFIPQQ
jgi:hypothetical protein